MLSHDATGEECTVTGAWLSNRPVGVSEGAKGAALLRVLVQATRAEMAAWEVCNEGSTYREWCVPAAELNARASAAVVDDDEAPEVEYPDEWPEEEAR